jgi:predicted RNA-binding protein with TRAM domain
MILEGKSYLNAFINDSATIAEKAGADIAAPAHKAAAYDANGNVVIAASGETAIGLILSDSPDPIKEGFDVNILIKHIGLGEAGAAVAKGSFVTVNGSGQIIPAASGSFVFGRAFTSAASAGELVQVQINPMGVSA